MMDNTPRPPTLPLLPLAPPNVLFPGARISVPVSETLAQPLIKLLTEADEFLLVAAVPRLLVTGANEGNEEQWKTWGCRKYSF